MTKQQKKQPQKGKADKKLSELAENAPAKSADDLVLKQLEIRKKREACARLLLEWYEKHTSKQKTAAARK